jgi:hypothetical protein
MPLNKITVESLAANAVTNVAIANGTIESVDLADSGVAAGVYGGASQAAVLTIDTKGRVTSASNVAVLGIDAHPFVFTAIGT